MAFALAAQNGLVKEVFRLESPLWSDLCTTFGYSFALGSGMLFYVAWWSHRASLPAWTPG